MMRKIRFQTPETNNVNTVSESMISIELKYRPTKNYVLRANFVFNIGQTEDRRGPAL
jgi:hypothetical protein